MIGPVSPCFTGETLKAYRIVRPLGQGGFGSVYEAYNQRKQRVALKQITLANLPLEKREARRQAFQREAYFLSTLQNSHLPRLFSYFYDQDSLWLVMQYIDGCTLAQYVEDCDGSLPLDEVLDIGIQLCEVLEYLHQQNPPIIFRDLKPANIMLTPDGHLFLIDFGIARFFKEGQSGDTDVLGTLGFSPPEQHGLGQTDPRSDIYALGATLYFLITGREYGFYFPRLRWRSNPLGNRVGWLLQQLVVLDVRRRRFCAVCLKAELQSLLAECQQPSIVPASPIAIWHEHAHTPTTSARPGYGHTTNHRHALFWAWAWRIGLIIGVGLCLDIIVALIQAALH